RWHELVLEGLTHGCLFHPYCSCCRRYCSNAQTSSPTRERRLRLATTRSRSISWRGNTKVIFCFDSCFMHVLYVLDTCASRQWFCSWPCGHPAFTPWLKPGALSREVW